MTETGDDARRTLAARFEEAREAARERRVDDAVDALDRATAVVESSLPAGALRARLEHGCERATAVVADEPLVAAEYCRAMRDAVTNGGSTRDGPAG